ncbi:hypothetical protein ABNF16_20630 [Paenibacillus larvae]|uniref:hypothetical protein n=1 Tax=Paenibacillus larvae TaxID=1464 RepID=UPI002892A40B|nr:hypothetical protein [Paenibacillus larvae]MDV3446246.1 hypothetical protein [Paenibacillus larvae]
MALDYLAAGIHPDQSAIIVQSLVLEIAELKVFYSMFVTVSALSHNLTVKIESKDKGYQDMYYGFLGYPVSQAADITVFKATVVPVKKPRLKGGFPGKNRVYTL